MKRLFLSVVFFLSLTCAAHAQYGRITPVTGVGAGTSSYLMSSGMRGYPGPLSYGSHGVTGLGAGTNSYLMSGAGSHYGSTYRSSVGYGYSPRGSYHAPSYGSGYNYVPRPNLTPYYGFGTGSYMPGGTFNTSGAYGGFNGGGWGGAF